MGLSSLSSHSGVLRITCSYPDKHSSILIPDQQFFLYPKPCMDLQGVRGKEKTWASQGVFTPFLSQELLSSWCSDKTPRIYFSPDFYFYSKAQNKSLGVWHTLSVLFGHYSVLYSLPLCLITSVGIMPTSGECNHGFRLPLPPQAAHPARKIHTRSMSVKCNQ